MLASQDPKRFAWISRARYPLGFFQELIHWFNINRGCEWRVWFTNKNGRDWQGKIKRDPGLFMYKIKIAIRVWAPVCMRRIVKGSAYRESERICLRMNTLWNLVQTLS